MPTGELAALGAALCWVFTSLAFAAAGRRVGSMTVNVTRSVAALAILVAIQSARGDGLFPGVDGAGFWILGLSGLIGLAIGDQCLFTAFVDIGPRIGTLLMTLAPPIAAAIAWICLDEALGALAIGGMAITLGGIAWVVMERPRGAADRPHPRRTRGIVLGVIAGACQAVGMVLAKVGMGFDRLPDGAQIDSFTALLVRMLFGAVSICLIALAARAARSPRTLAAAPIEISPEGAHLPPGTVISIRAAIGLIMVGIVFGPIGGVWLSLVAVAATDVGIATTLMALTPVFILPFARLIEGERISWRAGLGAAVAVAGVALLVLPNTDDATLPAPGPDTPDAKLGGLP